MPSPTKRQGNGPRLPRQVSDTFEGGGTLPRQHSEPISTHKRSVHHRRRDVVSTPSPRFGPPGKLSVSSDSDENSIPAERDAAALESCAHVKQCFVPLFRARSRGLGPPRPRGPPSPYDLLRGLLFLDRLQLKHAHVYLAAYHFVPLMMVLLALTVNLLLHVVMGIVFPLIAASYAAFDEGEPPPATANSVVTFYGRLVVPHVAAVLRSGLAFAGGATVGYKLMTIVGDAAIDGMRYVQHQRSRAHLLWFSLFTHLKHIWRKGTLSVALLFAFLAAELALVGVVCFSGNFGIDWSSRDRDIFYVAAAVIGLQTVYFAYSAWRLSRQEAGLCEEAVAMWWSESLPKCQFRGMLVMVAAGMVFALESGAAYGATCIAEGLVYLNLTHIFIATAARATLFCVRLTESARLCFTDATAAYAAAVFALPLLVVITVNTVLIDSLPVSSIQLPPLLLLIDALCQHTHEQREIIEAIALISPQVRTPEKGLLSDSKTRTRLSNAALVMRIGVKAVFLTQTQAFRHVAHYDARNALRAMLRLLLALFMTVTTLLGLWVSLQFAPALGAASGTHCQELAPGRIVVTSSVLRAELHALPQPVADPDELVYEPQEHLYDRHRYEGICQRQWATDIHAADLAYFSTLTYLDVGASDFSAMFSFFRDYRRNGQDWQVVDKDEVIAEAAALGCDGECPDLPDAEDRATLSEWSKHIDRSVSATFHHFRSPSRGASVIAIRGTEPGFARDALQNVLIFSEVFLFQAISVIVPGAGLLPESMVKDLIRVGSMIDVAVLDFDQRRNRHHYYHAVEAYIGAFTQLQAVKAAGKKRRERGTLSIEDIIITGHSLGGVVAQIVGSRLRTPAVAFSAPGIALLERKFSIDPHAIDAYITNVVASNDFLATIGKLGGNVNHIQCEHRRAEVCHSAELQTIRLWTMCPQYRQVTAINGSYSILPQPHEVVLSRVLQLFGY
jgi:hypothetical protein